MPNKSLEDMLRELITKIIDESREDISQKREAEKLINEAFVNFPHFDEKAEIKLQKAVELAPDNFYAHSSLGTCYFQHEKFKLAETEFKRALELKPDDTLSHLSLVGCYISLDKLKEAEDELKKAIKEDPHALGFYFMIGVFYKDHGTKKDIEAFYQEAVKYVNKSERGVIKKQLEEGFGQKIEVTEGSLEDKLRKLKDVKDSFLRDELKIVKEKLIARFAESELTKEEEYCKFIFEQLKAQKVLKGTYIENIVKVGSIAFSFESELSLQSAVGLRETYIFLKSTPMSGKAKKDIADFKKFKIKINEYIESQKELHYPDFKDYVLSELPDNLSKCRKGYILGFFEAIYGISEMRDNSS